jgi:hypothetical protein
VACRSLLVRIVPKAKEVPMVDVDAFVMHAQHRGASCEHGQWLEDIARWHEEHRQAAAMLEAIKAAWGKAEAALEEHARQIHAYEEHLKRHEQVFRDHDWAVDDAEDDSLVAEHRKFEAAHAQARTAHEQIEQLHSGVMAEVLELMKLTHPGALVSETR